MKSCNSSSICARWVVTISLISRKLEGWLFSVNKKEARYIFFSFILKTNSSHSSMSFVKTCKISPIRYTGNTDNTSV